MGVKEWRQVLAACSTPFGDEAIRTKLVAAYDDILLVLNAFRRRGD